MAITFLSNSITNTLFLINTNLLSNKKRGRHPTTDVP